MGIKAFLESLHPQVRRVVQNYNAVNRADKVLDQKKRDTPPLHPGTKRKFDVIIKSMPELKEKLEKKSDDLLDRMKSINIESSIEPLLQKSEVEKPRDRITHKLPEFGYKDPEFVPKGKCSLRQALEFISNHRNDNKSTLQTIAEKYNMEVADVQNVTDNFKVFELYSGEEGKNKSYIDDKMLNSMGLSNLEGSMKKLSLSVTEIKDKLESAVNKNFDAEKKEK